MKKRKKRKLHTFRKIFFGTLLIFVSFAAFFGYQICKLDAWQQFDENKILGADETLLIYDSELNEISTLYYKENRLSIPLSDIPEVVQKAFIATEDARFYEHKGIDLIRIAGAALEDIKQGGYVQGASTITQQLIKLSHLSSEKTMKRKAEEAVLAYLMEKQFSKDEILEMYLNYVYFGGGFYGIEAASRGYFGISAQELSAAQGAVLAGILKSPSAYAPHINYEKSMNRHNLILKLMFEQGYLTKDEYNSALNEKITLNMKKNTNHSYYIDYSIEEACEILNITDRQLITGGYRIYTALDSEMQSICDKIYSDKSYFPNDSVQSAVAVVDNDSGYIRAMLGGRGDYEAKTYNRAVEIRRQPGSVIKPIIVYAPAMEYFGYTAASVITDEPRYFGDYKPKNSGNKYYGNVTLRKAITSSLNVPAVTVLNDIGVDNGKRFAQKVGIDFDEKDNNLSLALGGFTYGVSPLQIANAYGAICDGFYTEAKSIVAITDKSGKILYVDNAKKERIMSDENAYLLTNMLCSVSEEGTGHRLNDLGFDVACKTGTVSIDDDQNRDAWICAYTSDIAVSVWIGYDNSTDGTLESKITGGSYPAKITHDFLEEYYKDSSPEFKMPNNIIKVKLDKHSITNDAVPALASIMTPQQEYYYEYFAKGTEPCIEGMYWTLPTPPDDFCCTNVNDGVAEFTFTINNPNTLYRLYRVINDTEQPVCEITGDLNEIVIIKDDKMPKSKQIEYFIRPFHCELEINGQKAQGADSIKIKITQ